MTNLLQKPPETRGWTPLKKPSARQKSACGNFWIVWCLAKTQVSAPYRTPYRRESCSGRGAEARWYSIQPVRWPLSLSGFLGANPFCEVAPKIRCDSRTVFWCEPLRPQSIRPYYETDPSSIRSHSVTTTLQKCGVKIFSVFLCQRCREIFAWNFGEIVRVPRFPGFGCPKRKIPRKAKRQKNGVTNGKFHTNFTQLGGGADHMSRIGPSVLPTLIRLFLRSRRGPLRSAKLGELSSIESGYGSRIRKCSISPVVWCFTASLAKEKNAQCNKHPVWGARLTNGRQGPISSSPSRRRISSWRTFVW